NAPYEPLLFDVGRLLFPHKGREQETLTALDKACRERAVAALIVEPLILGAGGMLIYGPGVLAEMARICKSHGALLIADEGMTGWGRSGTVLRLRAGRHRAQHRLLFKRPHGRCAAAGGDAVRRRDFRCALLAGPAQNVLSLQLLHRKSDRLRRGARQSRGLA